MLWLTVIRLCQIWRIIQKLKKIYIYLAAFILLHSVGQQIAWNVAAIIHWCCPSRWFYTVVFLWRSSPDSTLTVTKVEDACPLFSVLALKMSFLSRTECNLLLPQKGEGHTVVVEKVRCVCVLLCFNGLCCLFVTFTFENLCPTNIRKGQAAVGTVSLYVTVKVAIISAKEQERRLELIHAL